MPALPTSEHRPPLANLSATLSGKAIYDSVAKARFNTACPIASDTLKSFSSTAMIRSCMGAHPLTFCSFPLSVRTTNRSVINLSNSRPKSIPNEAFPTDFCNRRGVMAEPDSWSGMWLSSSTRCIGPIGRNCRRDTRLASRSCLKDKATRSQIPQGSTNSAFISRPWLSSHLRTGFVISSSHSKTIPPSNLGTHPRPCSSLLLTTLGEQQANVNHARRGRWYLSLCVRVSSRDYEKDVP